MIDWDRFELDLRAAVRTYAGAISSDLDAAQLAHAIARAEPRRRIRILDLPWPSSRMPRIACVVLIVALLVITATLMLAIGTRPPLELPAVLPAIPAVYECPSGSKPDEPGAFEQVRPPFNDMGAAMDRQSGRIVVVVPLEGADGWDTWTFDVCTNGWTRVGAQGALPDAYRVPELVYDWRFDLTIAVSDAGRTSQFDVGENHWQAITPASSTSARAIDRLAYDPAAGLVLAQAETIAEELTGMSQLWTYDPPANAWADLPQSGSGPSTDAGYYAVIAYDTTADRLVAVNLERQRTWLLDPNTGIWAELAVRSPRLNTGWFATGGEIAYDEAAQRVVVFSDGQGWAFNAVAGEWEVVFESAVDGTSGALGPQARLRHRLTYDPTNQRLVMIGGHYRTADGWVRADDVWAFETTTRQWIQLLEPSHIELAVDDGWVALPIPSSR